ncbi:MAG: Xaa-Pro aminopeptidase [Thermoleophilaceae bacterium]|nr:Xaa-Pro aminopeptidase [Thermoleophilaceae bacterium]
MPAARAEALEGLIASAELDGLLITHLLNVRYLAGFTGTNGLCAVAPGVRSFYTDFRYTGQAGREVDGFDLDPEDRELAKAALAALAGSGGGRVGFEDAHVSVRQLEKLREMAPDGLELVPAGDLVEKLRAVKDAGELTAIREAAKAVTGIYDHLREVEFAGRTERQVAVLLENEMRARGSEPSFPSIVAADPNSALPHHTPGDTVIAPGSLVVVDMGCVVDGYCSDCTRTFAAEGVSDHAHEIYDLVRAAQEAALEAVKPGADCKAVDSVARDMIEAAGHGERFGHGLGHGVGLEVHEGPNLSQRSEGSLETGNVVTVEPGVYLPDDLGVRIEDLVVVGADGPEALTSFPKSLITLE